LSLWNVLKSIQIGYSTTGDISHPPHVDDSDLTLNICLGRPFKGGTLQFLNSDGSGIVAVNQLPGQAVLHLGKTPHMADPITEGTRYNLIMWFKAKNSFHYFSNLPEQLQIHILSYLHAEDLCTVGVISMQPDSL
jgi:hypothetical protein